MNPYKENMFIWKLFINGVDATAWFRQFITSVVVKYENSKPTIATIDISAYSFLEGIFTEGVPIMIMMGEYLHDLFVMFKGTVIKRPEGHASEILTYKIQAIEGKKGTLAAKVKNFDIPYKIAIINEVIVSAGFIPVVDINDGSPIPASFSAIQNNKTDLEFLDECSKKWACTWWIDEPTNIIYFVDNDNLKDYSVSDYEFIYRSDLKACNVESISWKSGTPGGLVVTGSETITVQNKQINIDVFNAYDHDWMLSKQVRDSITTDKIVQISTAIHGAKTAAEQEAVIRQYYVPNDHVDKSRTVTNQKANGVNLDIDLNWPDFLLRPPRQSKIKYGSLNKDMPSSSLPAFIFGASGQDTTFYIQSVETGIRSGVASTKAVITR